MQEQEERVPSLFIVPLTQFFVGLFLFIALLNRQQDLTVLALLLLGVAVGAKLWSRFSLAAIDCKFEVDNGKVFPGEKIRLDLWVENAKFLPVWLEMKVPVGGALIPTSQKSPFTTKSGLLWYERVDFRWELKAMRRGVHQVGPPRLRVGDLLGFYPRGKKADQTLSILVYPRLVPLRSFPLPKREFFGVPGAKNPVQDPVYILGTRDYQHFRPSRYIHWKASARHNRLQEKIFEPSEQEKVLLLVEVEGFAGDHREEEFEYILEVAASLAVRMDRQGFAVGLVTNGLLVGKGPSILPVARGPQQLPAILEVLARLRPAPSGGIADILKQGITLPWGLTCVYLTCEKKGSSLVAQEFFKQRHIPTVFLVSQLAQMEAQTVHPVSGDVYSLDDIRIQGTKGK